MLSMFAFALLTTGQPLLVPPRADEPLPDVRLVADHGRGKVLIASNFIWSTTDGHPAARMYVIGPDEPARVLVGDVVANCGTRRIAITHAWLLDRSLATLGGGQDEQAIVPPQTSLGEDVVDFLCDSRTERLQRPSLGPDMDAAIRALDARFR